ncbi:polyketide biosynthesis protein PksE [Anaerocolumna cellulosilytica]|uniref:[acyl-carrier-protein] S-malonyltransferase n=1 Tax=Anaerocolumna cellulosilytica TaxID=433286 RepID=A0A6S6R4E4_9FIRM|nr:ACP S-malonyltransferase [Anaerocolumna cellulosilytica]MBB5196719.1 trans-AT polyketide synthase/acyltransferase/oxidoreductase domain-containing protein [Anaerocolumna cellulosilytica]BCJ93981.1 polyketide biosynthesis protein PksE [Anaerocolumna cellulosilytica]
MKAYVFPGQGSQYKGMGKELFEEFPELVLSADKILGYSIKALCLDDPDSKLGFTNYTQPALYTVNALTYLKKCKDSNETPDFVAGHSLGEYNALHAAGAFDFETGLRLVQKRGELMSQATGGGMAAIIGLKEKEIRDILLKERLEQIDIANLNCPSQIVISGPKEYILQAKPIFESNPGVKLYSMLNVSGAFHSRYMKESGKLFEQFMDSFAFDSLKIPVMANVSARPYKLTDIKSNLVKQITHSVQWTETICFLMGLGDITFEEIGMGKTLTGLLRYIKSEAQPLVLGAKEYDMYFAGTVAEGQNKEAKAAEQGLEKADKMQSIEITDATLGSEAFKRRYHLRYAYIAGAMYRGVSSKELVVKMGKAGMLGFLGMGGLSLSEIEEAINYIQRELNHDQTYGMNFLYDPANPEKEERVIDLYFRYGINIIEASAFMGVTSALIRYKAKGLRRNERGIIESNNKIIAKISRPEVAEAFMSPAPKRLVDKLLSEGKITEEEAIMLKEIPVANDLCVEADSGGHTDCGVSYTLLPAILKLRNDMMEKFKYSEKVHIGAAGGIGTPEAAGASFVLGADFIVTGSINQCTVEAGTSTIVKELLQQMNVQDTDYAPAGDMFEFGAKVQVLKKGLFFPARANKLYDLYRQFNSIEEIDHKTRTQIQEKYFKRSFESIYEELKNYYSTEEIMKADKNPKQKMAMIFKWYFHYSSKSALAGDIDSKVDYQVHCGPALGAFNQWMKGTIYESWQNRHVDEIALLMLKETASFLNNRFQLMKAFI